jgi:bifunctional UDP-N-acetylglucosamine pyrophosphorylase/glucosamine-1-phosphate N-acetyltransferase
MDDVAATAVNPDPKLEVFVQEEQLGTAMRLARGTPSRRFRSGSDPTATRRSCAPRRSGISAELDAGADLAVIGFETENPTGYGRLFSMRASSLELRGEGCKRAERALGCNSGIMGFHSSKTLLDLLGGSATTTPRKNSISPTPWRSPVPEDSRRACSRPMKVRSSA